MRIHSESINHIDVFEYENTYKNIPRLSAPSPVPVARWGVMGPKKGASPPKKKAAAPASDAMQPMTSEGSSSDWVKAKANMRRIGNLFLEHLQMSNATLSAEWGSEWDELTEEVVTTIDFWGLLATYLVSVYVIAKGSTNAGEHLDEKSALSTWRGLFNQMRQTFAASTIRETRVRCAPDRPAVPLLVARHRIVCRTGVL
jgi:hypothetical protein